MSIVINTNVSSLIAQRYLTTNNACLQSVTEQLSSGYRINNAGDDAAGLSIGQTLTTLIKGDSQALKNIRSATFLVSTAEAGLNTATEHVQRIRELTVQAATEIYSTAQKQVIINEIKERLNDLDRLAGAASFNGITLLDGTKKANSLTIQIGSGSDVDVNTIDIGAAFTDIHATALGLNYDKLDNAATITGDDFRDYIAKLDAALNIINSDMSKIGALTNTMETAERNLTTMVEASTQSRSNIMDVDIAAASSELVKYQILQSASATVLQQANQIPTIALQLLGQ